MAMIGTPGFPYPAMTAGFPPRRATMSGGLDEYLPMTQISPGASSFGDTFTPMGGLSSVRPQGLASGFSSGFSTGYTPNPAMSAWGAGASLTPSSYQGMRGANPFAPSGAYPGVMASAYRGGAPWSFPTGYGARGASSFYPYGKAGGMYGPSRAWGEGLDGRFMSPAQRTGKKVGDLITALLEENPGLQEKLESLDLDALKENIGPALERYRASVQQAIKPLPTWIDRKAIQLLDTPQARDLAMQFDKWLRKPPSPAVLADLHRQKVQRAYAEDSPYGGDYGGGGYSDMGEEPPQKSLLKRLTSLKSKFWPFGKKEESYGSGRMSGFNDADLEALLSSSMDSRRSPYRSRYSDEYGG